jgi:ZIP family zinc transporter
VAPESADRAAAAAPAPVSTGRLWLIGLLPPVLLAGLVLLLVSWGPADALQGGDRPPVERLTFQRVELGPGGFRISVLNDGPDRVTIAQVIVDDAYWHFTVEGDRELGHLGRTTLVVPYPWVAGEAHVLKVLTSTGATFEHEISVALETPRVSAEALGLFALIGVYVGVVPVAIGLLWFPLVARVGRTGLDFLLALTIGLLVFLLIDAGHDGLEIAAGVPGSFQGATLFFVGAAGAYLALEGLGRWVSARRARAMARGTAAHGAGWTLALLVAIGIGLHNFGEGLAIGAAFALGEAALGTLLIIGFTLHNTTEGLAIVAPLARERTRLADLARLGVIGGVPTIAGAWLGGLLYSPVFSVLCLAIGTGAIAQVVVQIGRQMAGDETVAGYFTRGPVLAGLTAGVAIMYSTGMLVG